MISVQEKYLDMLKHILNSHIQDCEIRAFGSRVNGTNRKYSDLDLAIVGSGKLDNRLLLKLKYAFMESRLPFRVDVLDYNSVPESFRKIIDSNYEIVKCA